MTTLTIYGQWAVYNQHIKDVETQLDTFVIELMPDESWKTPIGFNVTLVKVGD
jgi:hypothetical protein